MHFPLPSDQRAKNIKGVDPDKHNPDISVDLPRSA
jgi:hypothetical protein